MVLVYEDNKNGSAHLPRNRKSFRLIDYIKVALRPIPPASGGTGSSPLLSDTKARYLKSRRSAQINFRSGDEQTYMRFSRSRSSGGTDGLAD